MSKVSGFNFEWVKSVEEFRCRAEKLKEEATHMYDNIAKESSLSFSTIAQKLADFELKFNTESNILKLYQSVHTDKMMRDASMEADKIISDLEIDLSMRKDVFEQFVKLKERLTDDLSGEYLRYVEKKIKDGRHNGLHCDEHIRNEVQSISKELSNLKIDFEKNLSEENHVLEFSEDELKGCTEFLINSLERSETDATKKKVTLKYPHYFPIIKDSINPETRKKMEFAFNTRCKDVNGPLLEKMLALRLKKAKLLGYDTHADYVLSMRMAKSAKRVKDFLEDLRLKLLPTKDEEISKYLEYKKKMCDENNWEFNGQIDAWDLRFFMNKYEQDRFSVDQEKIREYFPVDTVVAGMFRIYEELLGLKFEEVVCESWHNEVKLYSVVDADDAALLGYFFLDLHPRDGKYGHAQVKLLQLGGVRATGAGGEPERQVTVVVMLANFTRPSEGRPALLAHNEVTTLFHEFGHVMHGLCSRTDFGILTGFKVEWDFVECPSQMLENWCWEEGPLAAMSGHHETGERLAGALVHNLLRSRVANVGTFTTRQICLAAFDQRVHGAMTTDPVQEYADVTARYLGVPVTPGTNMPATFGHMAGGYDAQYYGYLWSEVFAADMFVSRFRVEGGEGLLGGCGRAGRDYRRCVLAPGSTRDAADLVEAFLGRPPSQEAFLALMGLRQPSI